MNASARFIFAAVGVVITILMTHSCFRQNLTGPGGVPKIDRAQLCSDGGANVNEQTNECECPAGLVWNGVRCDIGVSALVMAEEIPAPVVEPVVTTPPSAEQSANVPEVKAELAVPESTAEVEKDTSVQDPVEKVEASLSWIPQLIRACRIAGGSYLAAQQYCHCPDGKVLMGRRCRLTDGRMTDDICLRAINKGRWQGGVCSCPEGKVFSPGRGGCVEPFTGDSTILRRICENTVNQGKWNERQHLCMCPAGKVLFGETCVPKTNLRSADICESRQNRGAWDSHARACRCPEGQIWFNQSCENLADVDSSAACHGDLNKGRWNKAKNTCDCPRGTSWNAARKSCGK